jgi:hypothetical protein
LRNLYYLEPILGTYLAYKVRDCLKNLYNSLYL